MLVHDKLTNAIREARDYYRLFGARGVFLLAKARACDRKLLARTHIPGLRYPFHLRLRTSDVALFSEVLVNSQYDWPLPTPPKIIVDAGANIGLTSIFYANRYPEARIIAIEPEASNFEVLVENTSAYPNITALRAALWRQSCELSISDPGDGDWDCWGFRTAETESSSAASVHTVRGVTLDELMEEIRIDHVDLLKLDIEGAEKEVFESSSKWIERVSAIAIEVHDRFKAGCSQALLEATSAFDICTQRGETTFLHRKERDMCFLTKSGNLSRPSHPSRNELTLPVKIEQAASVP